MRQNLKKTYLKAQKCSKFHRRESESVSFSREFIFFKTFKKNLLVLISFLFCKKLYQLTSKFNLHCFILINGKSCEKEIDFFARFVY